MNFLDLAKSRYSVRSYSDADVEQEKLDKIVEAAMLAPTACNNQPQRIYLLHSADALAKIRSLTPCTYDAPAVFMICSDSSRSWHSPFDSGYESGEMDASIVCTHMMLEAQELGLGSCWVLLFRSGAHSLCLLPAGEHKARVPASGGLPRRRFPSRNRSQQDAQRQRRILRALKRALNIPGMFHAGTHPGFLSICRIQQVAPPTVCFSPPSMASLRERTLSESNWAMKLSTPMRSMLRPKRSPVTPCSR